MVNLGYVLIATYFLAINIYGAIILKLQKKDTEKEDLTKKNIRDSRLVLTGILGGALGIYIFMFIYKYRLKSMFLMILMPLLIALTVYLIFTLFNNGLLIIT